MGLLTELKSTFLLSSKNLFLRGITLGAKFLLLIFLAKYVSTAELGQWGIITTSIALALYVVGLDFYTFSSRAMLEKNPQERPPMLRDQFLFYLLNYVLLYPLLSILFLLHIIDEKFIFIFYIILTLEHLGQEAYRTLIVFSKPVEAHILLFLRNGAWAYLLIILWLLGFESGKNMETVFYFWMGGGILTLALAAYYFIKFQFLKSYTTPVNWTWLKQGLRVSALLFSGTIGYKIIDFADRYFLQFYRTEEEVGVYIFYANLCNLVETIVYSSVLVIFTPKLIEQFHKNAPEYKNTFQKFSNHIYLYTFFSVLLLCVAIYPVLLYLQKDEFIKNLPTFFLLIAGKSILNISMIYHYMLYIRRNDKRIVLATTGAALLNIVLNFLLIPALGMLGAALATLLSLCCMLIAKKFYCTTFEETIRLPLFTKK